MKAELSYEFLHEHYSVRKKTDSQIASELGVDRTAITHARKTYKIKARGSTGVLGEELTIEALKGEGFAVTNTNELTKTFPFDLLVDHYIRVEVKSALEFLENRFYKFCFTLSEKIENGNVVSGYRIRLKNGRTRKLYRKTCDYLILAGISETFKNQFFIIPSDYIPDHQGTIAIPANPDSNSKYNKFRGNWNLLRR